MFFGYKGFSLLPNQGMHNSRNHHRDDTGSMENIFCDNENQKRSHDLQQGMKRYIIDALLTENQTDSNNQQSE